MVSPAGSRHRRNRGVQATRVESARHNSRACRVVSAAKVCGWCAYASAVFLRAGSAFPVAPGQTRSAGKPGIRRHAARHLRTRRLHCPPGSPGAETAGQPEPFPRRLCAKQPIRGTRDSGQAGQGRRACQGSGSGGAYTRRTPCRDDLDAAPEMDVWNRHTPRHPLLMLRINSPCRDLPGLWWGGVDHRVHRGSGGDREDSLQPGCEKG